MSTPSQMIEEYLSHPRELRAAVQGLSQEQLTARPIPGKWSVLEVVCHLADFEPVYADRMKRIIALENPLLMGADENLFAKRLTYHDRDLDEELTVIDFTRRSMARILKTLPAEAFGRSGVHSERGLKTLAEMLAQANVHVRHHLPFIAEKRRAMA